MPFTLVSKAGVQRHPLRHEVRMLREIWPEIRMVILMPPYLTLVCDTIPLTTPKTIAGVTLSFYEQRKRHSITRDFLPSETHYNRGKTRCVGTSNSFNTGFHS